MIAGDHAEEGVKQDQKKSVKERMREKNKKNENGEVEFKWTDKRKQQTFT
jgi:hypothetical protein